jgi:2-dehydro-3-deoxyglucarate aldolase/4-hydroxy-2-oxoheptanedioate aldolase
VENAVPFRDKLKRGQVCLGTCITFTDPTVTEALAESLDFVWVDMEHNPVTLSAVQGHLLAAKGTEATVLVRVPWNDPVLIKPVLDMGATGVIVPLVRTAEDVRRAVAACRYMPEGLRGYGPRRPSHYGRRGGPDYMKAADATVFPIPQIEHIDALNNLDEILAVPGLVTVVVGPNDLAGSLGYPGQPRHAEVLRAIDTVLAKGRAAGIPVGVGAGVDPDDLLAWARRGMNWISMGADFLLMVRAITQLTVHLRAQASGTT